jgi:hypothetical protein
MEGDGEEDESFFDRRRYSVGRFNFGARLGLTFCGQAFGPPAFNGKAKSRTLSGRSHLKKDGGLTPSLLLH